jgi:hypothetical protein
VSCTGVPVAAGVHGCKAQAMRSVGRDEAIEMLEGFVPGRLAGDRPDDLLLEFSDQDLAGCAACLRDTIEAMDDWEFSSVMPLEVHEADELATDLEALVAGRSLEHPETPWLPDLIRARHLDWSAVAAVSSRELEPAGWFRVSIREYRSLLSAVDNATIRDPALMSSAVAPYVEDAAVRKGLRRALTDIESHVAHMSYRHSTAHGASVEASLEISTGHTAGHASRLLQDIFPRPDRDAPTVRAKQRWGIGSWRKMMELARGEQDVEPIQIDWSVTDLGFGSLVRLDLRCTDTDYLSRKTPTEIFTKYQELEDMVRQRLQER